MKRLLKIYMAKPELAGAILLLVLVVFFQLRSNGAFLSLGNIQGMLSILPEMGLVAIGVTILMICGEFDLSVGSVFAIAPMTMAILTNNGCPFWAAILISLALCASLGFITGFITLRFAIPSFITSLGMMYVVRSLTVVISGGFPPSLSEDLPFWLFTRFIDSHNIVRMSFIWFLGAAIVTAILLSLTNIGNWIRATGGYIEAASAMGIPVTRVKISAFILCSLLAGFAGILQVLRLNSPLPSLGEGMELQAVAAAVIGGTALTGGIGTVLGALIGATLIRVIDNGLVMIEINANWFKFAIGSLTILAVIANSRLASMARRLKIET